jgi:dipeptidyl aminopeptidase/acylaminoacyl peptidase
MKKLFFSFCSFFLLSAVYAQSIGPLTVEKIMHDPKWIGTSPGNLQWSQTGNQLFFRWNPEGHPADSMYIISTVNKQPVKASIEQTQLLNSQGNFVYNQNRTQYVYAQLGDIYLVDVKTGKNKRVTNTMDQESSPLFCFNDTKIVYTRNQNLYAWDMVSGETEQLTNIRSGAVPTAPSPGGGFGRNNNTSAPPVLSSGSTQEEWLKNDQLRYFQVLRERKEKRESTEAYNMRIPQPKEMRALPMGDGFMQGLTISADGRFVSYRVFRQGSGRNTIVPSYVTESGFTTDINARTKVGTPQGSNDLYIYDRIKDTLMQLKAEQIPGIKDLPDYVKDYPKQLEDRKKRNSNRSFTITNVSWSPKGNYAVIDLRAIDNKDRWLMRFDSTGFKLLDRQRDEAWIAGPGIGFGRNTGWIDDNRFWFHSEKTGYSHLYVADLSTNTIQALTSGNYEVQQAELSKDKKFFYLTTNEVHPGEQHFYRLPVSGGKAEKITSMTGAHQVSVSPDEKYIAYLYSYSNKPWELYLQENKSGAKPEQITNKAMSPLFSSYAWRDPEVITFPARDGATVYGRLYKPKQQDPNKPAVIFVHGAGYLQNAHKWWSSYFREYMFHNLLADLGYTVLDIDYRGSAGYGRDWRTGIYRHMGGKDLTDHVDAIDYLAKNHNVNAERVGIYGGSYGGFITLMAMFTTPGKFAAGAALRPVTDWAQYNHGYTANILNEPFTDSIAYRKSSPLYFAEGLNGHLLICHGMVDVNVHYQDAVKLAQRLIELGKDNWELASYPMEDHGFVEPSSWTDEYKRILKLFEQQLRKRP